MYFRQFTEWDNLYTSQEWFLSRLGELLRELSPAKLDPGGIEVKLDSWEGRGFLEVALPHSEEKEFLLLVEVFEDEVIVYFGQDHLHFDVTGSDDWLPEALEFVGFLLREDFEVHEFYKGENLIAVKLFVLNEEGKRKPFSIVSISGFFSWATINPFLRKRQEIKRITFA